MSAPGPDDPHVRELRNEVETMKQQLSRLEESQQLLAAYVRAVEEDTIAEPDLPAEVRERAGELAAEVSGMNSDGENPTDESELFFGE